MEWAVGKVGEIFPDGAGKLMMPGSEIRWEIHYHSVGEEVVDDVVDQLLEVQRRHGAEHALELDP